MFKRKPPALIRALPLIRKIWFFAIVTIATVAGASIGWANHGLVGAIALGFVGFVVGVIISAPEIFVQLWT